MSENGTQSSAVEWLGSGPKGIRDRALISQILASFDGAPAVSHIVGPETLLRAVGKDSSGRLANAYRGYWVRESTLFGIHRNLGQFEGWLNKQELSAAAEWRYRAFTAICVNWNDFDEFAEMQVPAGEKLACLIGRVAPQPLHSAMLPGASSTPMLRGGAEQVFVRGGDANPFWVFLRAKPAIF